MTFLEYAVIGYAIGFLTSAPVGPANIMAIGKAAQSGFREGLYVGLGAALADALFAGIAIFGVSVVTGFIEGRRGLIESVGALFLIGFGVKVMLSNPHLDGSDRTWKTGLWADITGAFFMVITNPGVVFAYVAIVGGLGHWRPGPGEHAGALAMVAGVFLGATTWWALLAAMVTRHIHRINDLWLARANDIVGVILIICGVGIGGYAIF